MEKEKYELCIRLSPDEEARLKADARLCGLTKTAYLRRLIMGAEIKGRPTAELKALRTEIHHIGNNINQIARNTNAAGSASKEEAHSALVLLDKVYGLMAEIAGH